MPTKITVKPVKTNVRGVKDFAVYRDGSMVRVFRDKVKAKAHAEALRRLAKEEASALADPFDFDSDPGLDLGVAV